MIIAAIIVLGLLGTLFGLGFLSKGESELAVLTAGGTAFAVTLLALSGSGAFE